MKKIAGMLLLSAAMVALTAAPASAQGELGFGFANQYWNGCCANGFMFDYSRPVHTATTTQSRIFGDFSFTRFSGEESDTGIVAGIRETFLTDRRVQVFVQASGGIMHWSEQMPFDDSGNDGLIGGWRRQVRRERALRGPRPIRLLGCAIRRRLGFDPPLRDRRRRQTGRPVTRRAFDVHAAASLPGRRLFSWLHL